LVLLHGCNKDVAESVLRGEATLQPSENDYDWLGNGIYFWVDSPERALAWAKLRRSTPSEVGAFAYPGNCLNLTDYGVMNELALAYEATVGISAAAGTPLPVNSVRQNRIFIKRQLDCAVIQLVHKFRDSKGMDAYNTVWGRRPVGGALAPVADHRLGIWGLIGSGVWVSRMTCLGPGRKGMEITSGRRDARGLSFSVVIPARVMQPKI
jgi:hypothetical protein